MVFFGYYVSPQSHMRDNARRFRGEIMGYEGLDLKSECIYSLIEINWVVDVCRWVVAVARGFFYISFSIFF